MNWKKAICLILGGLVVFMVISACGPSQEELDATATKIEAEVFATQIAGAPTQTMTPVPTSTSTPASSFTPTPTPPSAEALLEEAFTGLSKASYHFVAGDQQDFYQHDVVGDFQAPDRFRQTVVNSFLGIGSEMEIVFTGEKSYAKDSRSLLWQENTESEPDSYLQDFFIDLVGVKSEDVEGLRLIGEESLNGELVYHMQGTVPIQKISGLGDVLLVFINPDTLEEDPQVSYWIGVADGYFRKIEFNVEVPDMDSFSRIITLSDFSQDVVVEAPDTDPSNAYSPGLADILSEFSPDDKDIVHLAPDGKGDYPDLNTAVEAVDPGTTLMLEPGLYQLSQQLEIDKSLRLIGAGVEKTEIVSAVPGYVLRFTGDGDFAIEGILFRHEGGSTADVVVVEDGRVAITDCAFTGATGWIEEERAAGLRLLGSTIGVVQNCTASENHDGIMIEGQAQPLIVENNSSENSSTGITVSSLAMPILVNNNCSENGNAGISYYGGAGGFVQQNECSGNLIGIGISENAWPIVELNTFNGNGVGINYDDASKGLSQGNDCSRNIRGIAVSGRAMPTLEDNTCNDNEISGIEYWENGSGVARYNNCSGNSSGITVLEQADPTLRGNTCNRNEDAGIILRDQVNSIVRDNDCSGNTRGKAVLEQAHPTITENTCNNNETYGIVFEDTTSGLAQQNVCSENEIGIFVRVSANPDLVDNNCQDNIETDVKDERQ